MIIHEIRMHSYGKFKNRIISFSDGLNYIYGENEAGKSTIMAFIKAMLYGFSGRGAEGDRKRYLPWDQTVLSGEMIVTLSDGRKVLISRTSGKTPAQDKCIFLDAITGEVCDVDLSIEIGLQESAFLKTVFIRQNASGPIGGDDEITNKLLNLVDGGNTETGYDSVTSHLKDKMKNLKHLRGDGGEINTLVRKITDLNSQISKENAENQSRLSFFSEEKKLQEEITLLENEISDLQKRYSEGVAEEEKRVKEMLQNKIDGLKASEQKVKAFLQNLLSKEKELSAFSAEIDDNVFNSIGENADYAYICKRAKHYKNIFKALSIMTFLLTFGFWIMNYKIPAFFSVVISAISFALYLLQRKIQNKAQIEILELANRENIRDTQLARYSCNTLKEYTEKRAEWLSLSDKIGAAKEKLNFLQTEIQNFSEIEVKTLISNDFSTAIVEERLQKENILSEKKHRLAELNGYLNAMREGSQGVDVLVSERLKAEEKLQEAEVEYKSLKLALETLEEVYGEISRDFSPRINDRASQYLSIITGNTETLLLDKNYNVTMGRDVHRPLNFFSGGTVDQAFLSVRLAVSELILGENKLPFFLDDSFIQYDDEREKNAIQLIKNLSLSRQLFWFSCKNRDLKDINRIAL